MQLRYFILIILSAILLTGCHHTHEETEEHHNHSFIYTAYSGSYELFAEADPMVTGRHSHVVVHLTSLSDFKPVIVEQLKATLTVGQASEESEAEILSSGIYEFAFEPAVAGEGLLTINYGDKPAVNVTVFADGHSAHEAVEEAEINNTNAITFPKEQSWKVNFSTEECKSGQINRVVKAMAQVLPSVGDEAVITAPVAGVVTFASDAIVEGRQVGAGQILFTIDNSSLKEDGNIAVMASQAESDYNLAKSEYERKAALSQDKIVSEADLMEAKRNYESAKAKYDNLRRNYSSGKQRVTAPFGGYVTSLTVRSGEFVQTGQSVMSISKGGNLYLKAELQPKFYEALQTFSSANIKMPSGQVASLDELGGSMLSYGKSIGANSALIPVTFKVKANKQLLPGTFVEMFIKSGEGRYGITVPEESIVEEMGNYFVFVQLTPELFEKREVKLGGTDGNRREILSGVSEGDRVVGKGAVMVKLSQAAGTLDAHSGHVH